MVVAIHQPNYIPWGGYFYKILSADKFVFLDDVQYSRGFINRNKIKMQNGPHWLTVPINGSQNLAINEIALADDEWKNKHKKTIEINYARAPYYKEYAGEIFRIIDKADNLCDLNTNLVIHLSKILGATCEFHNSSEYKLKSMSDDRLIDIVEKVGGDTYLSGGGGANYQSEEKFKAHGINLLYSDFRVNEYPQLWGGFEPRMSIIDILFNCGKKSREIILGKQI